MSKKSPKQRGVGTSIGLRDDAAQEAYFSQTVEAYAMKEGQTAIGRIHERLAKIAALPEAVRKMTLREAQEVGIHISPTGPY